MFQYLAERVVGQTLKTLAWRDEVWEANIVSWNTSVHLKSQISRSSPLTPTQRSDLPFDRTSMLPHLEVLHFAHANLTHEAMREYALKFPSLKVLSCHTPRPSGTLLPEKGNRVLNRKVWAIWREPVSEEEREQDAYAGIDIQCLLAGDLAALRAGATSPPPVVGGYQPVVSTWLYIPPRK
jgi:hypothetical protein